MKVHNTELAISYFTNPLPNEMAGMQDRAHDVAEILQYVGAAIFGMSSIAHQIKYRWQRVHQDQPTPKSISAEELAREMLKNSNSVTKTLVGWHLNLLEIDDEGAGMLREAAGKAHWVTMHPQASDEALQTAISLRDAYAVYSPEHRVGIVGSTVSKRQGNPVYASIFEPADEKKIIDFARRLKNLGIATVMCTGDELRILANTELAAEMSFNVVNCFPKWDGLPEGITPGEAAHLRASYLCMGDLFWNGPFDPLEAAERVHEEIQQVVA